MQETVCLRPERRECVWREHEAADENDDRFSAHVEDVEAEGMVCAVHLDQVGGTATGCAVARRREGDEQVLSCSGVPCELASLNPASRTGRADCSSRFFPRRRLATVVATDGTWL